MTEMLGPYLLGPNDTPENGIYTGDARELAKAIPDESVDLIFTDPPYIGDVQYLYEWLGAFAARALREGGSLLCFFAIGNLTCVLPALTPIELQYRWMLTATWAGYPMLYGRLAVKSQHCLWIEKGHSIPTGCLCDTHHTSQRAESWTTYLRRRNSGPGLASWGKDYEICRRWLDKLATYEAIVLDPFCGMGSIAVAAKQARRRHLAFEIEPGVAEMARERVRNTQPPLFAPQPEQAEMEFVNETA